MEEEEERDDLDSAEDAVEDRELSREAPAAPELTGSIPAQPPQPPVPRLPIGRVQGRIIDLDDAQEEEESSVIDVDEPNEPLGDGPEPYEDDRYDRNRSRDQRGRDQRGVPPRSPQSRPPMRPPLNRSQNQHPNQHQNQPQNQQRNQPRNIPPNGPENPKMNDPAQEYGAPARDPETGGEGAEGPRRRRRRRGRRGRGGRNREGVGQQGQPIADRNPDDGPPPFEEAPTDLNDAGDPDASRTTFHGGEESDMPVDQENHASQAMDKSRQSEITGSNSERLEAIFDTEDAQDAAAAGQAEPASEGMPNGGALDEPLKKRRRRRGGRRHRRRRDNAAGEPIAAAEPEPLDDAAAAPPEEAAAPESLAEVVEEAPAKATRRRRSPAGAARKTPRTSRKAPIGVASVEPPPPVPVPIVRTGSTDRHLVLDDIPVDPEPVRRPRSVRDLDAVPDDFD